MDIIYKPKGRAAEYAEWAANPYEGCLGACEYCFGPDLPAHKGSREEYHARQVPKHNVIERMREDIHRLELNEPDANVLMSFTSDLYPNDEAIRLITTELLTLFHGDYMGRPGFTVLTKGGFWAPQDFHLYAPGRDVFATTIVLTDEAARERVEPGASSLQRRWNALAAAHKRGIETWISVEPVIDPDQALAVIERAADCGDVGHVRVGPLNYHALAATIDWKRFGAELAVVLARTGIPYYIKQDLRPHMPAGFGPFDTRGDGESCEAS